MQKGDTVKGHFCYDCLRRVNNVLMQSENNPRKTDWCLSCDHRAEGIDSPGIVGDWMVIYPAHNPEPCPDTEHSSPPI